MKNLSNDMIEKFFAKFDIEVSKIQRKKENQLRNRVNYIIVFHDLNEWSVLRNDNIFFNKNLKNRIEKKEDKISENIIKEYKNMIKEYKIFGR